MKGYWTCQRVSGGERCKTVNPNRLRKCSACEKTRPKKRQPAHRAALDLSYDEYIEINGGFEICGICDRAPSTRRLDRDHDHKTHEPRGLLCARCNRALPNWVTIDWLIEAAAYLNTARLRRQGIHLPNKGRLS